MVIKIFNINENDKNNINNDDKRPQRKNKNKK